MTSAKNVLKYPFFENDNHNYNNLNIIISNFLKFWKINNLTREMIKAEIANFLKKQIFIKTKNYLKLLNNTVGLVKLLS